MFDSLKHKRPRFLSLLSKLRPGTNVSVRGATFSGLSRTIMKDYRRRTLAVKTTATPSGQPVSLTIPTVSLDGSKGSNWGVSSPESASWQNNSIGAAVSSDFSHEVRMVSNSTSTVILYCHS